MNYPLHEALPETTADTASGFTGDEVSELAQGLHTLWHALAHGVIGTERGEGVQKQQHWVLVALRCGSRRMCDLAEHAQTSQASLTGIVDRLEHRGMVERVRSAEDRRVIEVAITDAGRAEIERVRERFRIRLGELLEPLEPQDRHTFLRIVNTIATCAKGHGRTDCPEVPTRDTTKETPCT